MNEIENQLSELIKKAIEVAEKTGEFAIDQAPLLLQEFYRWHIAESVVYILIFITIKVLLGKFALSFGYKNKEQIPEAQKDNYYLKKDGRYYSSSFTDGSSDVYVLSIVVKVLSYLSLIGVVVHVKKIIYITIAPKLYLVEYFLN